MSWQNNGQNNGGKGPWGGGGGNNGGNQNPWQRPKGGGGGGGGGQPPDLEELLRQLQDKLRQMFKGGGYGNVPPHGGSASALRAFILGAITLLGLWLASGIYTVQVGQQGVVLRFGEYNRTEQSGLRFHLPWPFEMVLLPEVTSVNRIEIGAEGTNGLSEGLIMTADENVIDMDFTVFWQIKDAREFLFNIRDPESTILLTAESAMREVVSRSNVQDALTIGRERIEADTRQRLQEILDNYKAGVQITQVQLRKVDPPAQVIDAFNDVTNARTERVTLEQQARAYEASVVPVARGEAQRIKAEADGYREQVISLAKGEAQRFSEVYRAYSTARDVVSQRLYLETMEQVLSGASKLIMDGKNSGVLPYLPLPALKPAAQPAQ